MAIYYSFIAKKFSNNSTNVTLFLLFVVLKITIWLFSTTNANTLISGSLLAIVPLSEVILLPRKVKKQNVVACSSTKVQYSVMTHIASDSYGFALSS